MLYGEYGRTGVYPLQELLRTLAPLVDGDRGPDRHGQAADPLPADHQPVPPQSLSQRPRDRRRCRPLRPAAAQLRPRLSPCPRSRTLASDAGLRVVAFLEPVRYEPATYMSDPSHRAPGELAAAARARGLRRAAVGQPAHPRLLCHARRLRHGGAARGHLGRSRCCARWMRRSSPPACSPARRWSPTSTASPGAPSCRRSRRASSRRSTAARRWPRSTPRSAPRAACRSWEDFYAQFEDLYVKLNGVNHLLLRFRT